jgi:hypothetical protein
MQALHDSCRYCCYQLPMGLSDLTVDVTLLLFGSGDPTRRLPIAAIAGRSATHCGRAPAAAGLLINH